MQLFEREIGREVLFGDRCQGAFRFVKNGVGRANPDAVQQCVDRQQPFRFVECSRAAYPKQLHSPVHRNQLAPAGLAECLERIDVSIVDAFVKFFDRHIRLEVLFHDEFHQLSRVGEDSLRGAQSNTVQQRIDRQQRLWPVEISLE